MHDSLSTTKNKLGKRYTLLVVDDEVAILNAVRRLLRRRYNILTAATVDEAFTLLEQNEIHLVMSDQRMPKMSGVEFLTFVKECYPSCIRVLFTGYADTQSAIEAINSGKVYAYLSKPWDPEQLRLMISQATERHDLIQERNTLLERLQETNIILEKRNRELKSANQQLQDLDRLKNVFMELVSHELNTPITIIQGYAYLLNRQDDGPLHNTTQRALQGVQNNALRLGKITNKIFKFLESNSPHVSPHYESVPLDDIFAQTHQTVAPFLAKRQQDLRLENPEKIILETDRNKLTDALVNLVMNAIKFSPDGDQITLRAALHTREDPRDTVRIDIVDQGTGIRQEDMQGIFETFFGTFDSKHHSSGEFEFGKRGIGLGLAIVKKFVETLGGTVGVTSAPEQGTTFTIDLPVNPSPQTAETAPKPLA